jgi:hypothetical protein
VTTLTGPEARFLAAATNEDVEMQRTLTFPTTSLTCCVTSACGLACPGPQPEICGGATRISRHPYPPPAPSRRIPVWDSPGQPRQWRRNDVGSQPWSARHEGASAGRAPSGPNQQNGTGAPAPTGTPAVAQRPRSDQPRSRTRHDRSYTCPPGYSNPHRGGTSAAGCDGRDLSPGTAMSGRLAASYCDTVTQTIGSASWWPP